MERINSSGSRLVSMCGVVPAKRWKFSGADLSVRSQWDEYMAAYDLALARCSTPHAPWYVIPANKKWFRNWAVAQVLVETFEEMDPQYPRPKLDIKRLEGRLRPEIKRPPADGRGSSLFRS